MQCLDIITPKACPVAVKVRGRKIQVYKSWKKSPGATSYCMKGSNMESRRSKKSQEVKCAS